MQMVLYERLSYLHAVTEPMISNEIGEAYISCSSFLIILSLLSENVLKAGKDVLYFILYY